MVSYMSAGPTGRENATLMWCPRCGALGLETQELVRRWQLPDPGLSYLPPFKERAREAAAARKRAGG